MVNRIRTRRLTAADLSLARNLFAMMSAVFEEDATPLREAYLRRLLSREDFWTIAAFVGEHLAGGLTAHALPMTRNETKELFIYDLAVDRPFQRQGVGRALVSALRENACALGMHTVFVPAEADDTGALEFYRTIGGQASPVTMFTFEPSQPD
jgi:aminoglycoside 3-N-acetyltransferase I